MEVRRACSNEEEGESGRRVKNIIEQKQIRKKKKKK